MKQNCKVRSFARKCQKYNNSKHVYKTFQSLASKNAEVVALTAKMETNRVTGFIKGYRFKFLIDSGASVSCISLPYIAKLRISPTQIQTCADTRVRGVNGALIDVVGTVELPVKICGVIMHHTFSIIANLYTPCILGHDFLMQNDAKIDFKQGLLTLKDGIATVAFVNSKPPGTPVTILEESILPPRSQCIIRVHVSAVSDSAIGVLLEPHDSLQHKYQLIGSKCIVHPDHNNTVPYLVLNPTNESIILHANSIIGLANPAETVTPFDEQDIHPAEQTEHTVAAASKVIDPNQLLSTAKQLGIDFSKSHLTEAQQNALLELLGKYRDIFAVDDSELGCCDILQHRIDTGDAAPVRQRFYSQTPKVREETRRQIQTMLDNNIIEPSTTEWHAPVVLVRKANGQFRFAVDYRKLNAVTQNFTFPLPKITDTIQSLGERQATIFSSLDLRQGFFQIKLDPETAHKTGFITPEGVYQFTRMPFGLKTAPMTFQMVMSEVFRSMTYSNCLVYLDDVLVFSNSFHSHLNDLEQVFCRLRKANLKLSPSKCTFATKSIKFLGHIISSDGIRVNPEKTKALLTYPAPRNVRDLRSFLGSTNYFKRYIKDYAAKAAPLTALLKADKPYNWTSDCQTSFETLKTALSSPPVLAYPDFDRPFTLSTDASGSAIGYILEQPDKDGHLRAIAYGGRALRAHEKKWTISELECLAVIEGIRCYHHFLADKPFDIYTDHSALKWLMNIKLSAGRLARWALLLQAYQFRIFHRPGKQNKVADALSRRPYEPEHETVPDKPNVLVASMFTHSHTSPVQAFIEYDGQDDSYTQSGLCAIELVSEEETTTNESFVFMIGDDLKAAQRTSADFKDIIAYLEDGDLPPVPKVARRIVAESPYYIIQNQILYHLFYYGSRGIPKGDRLVKQLAVPEAYRSQALEAFHDSLAGGAHSGIERTYHNLRKRYYWPKMWKDVYDHVHSCDECQRAKRDYQAKPAPLHPLPVGDIFTRFHIDILGPLPETQYKEKYVLVIVDSFTKWVEAYPLKSQSSIEIKNCLFDTFARYGAPSHIVSDRGANFLSKIVSALCELFSVKRVHTSAYHPQTNSTVERFNAVIGQSLRTYLDEHQENWSSYLPGILMAYRAGVSTQSTKHSPYFMVFGREMVLPIDVALTPKQSLGKTVQEHLTNILNNLEVTRKIATTNMEKAQQRYTAYYDRQAKQPSYAPGDKVLLYNPFVPKNKASKLWKKWSGPYYITQLGPNHTYQLRRCSDNTAMKVLVHANRLKPYFSRTLAHIPPDQPNASQQQTQQQQPTQQQSAPPQPTAVHKNPVQGLPNTPNDQDQWHAIDQILACKRQGQNMLYRVKWSETGQTEWVNGRDIKDEAKRQFHTLKTASGKRRKRPLQRHKFFNSP